MSLLYKYEVFCWEPDVASLLIDFLSISVSLGLHEVNVCLLPLLTMYILHTEDLDVQLVKWYRPQYGQLYTLNIKAEIKWLFIIDIRYLAIWPIPDQSQG